MRSLKWAKNGRKTSCHASFNWSCAIDWGDGQTPSSGLLRSIFSFGPALISRLEVYGQVWDWTASGEAVSGRVFKGEFGTGRMEFPWGHQGYAFKRDGLDTKALSSEVNGGGWGQSQGQSSTTRARVCRITGEAYESCVD